MFQIAVTNDCKAPRFQVVADFGSFFTKAAAEKVALAWNRHIAPYNRVMKQNVQYAVKEVS